MKTSHQGLGITTEEYDVLMVHCVASLEACGVREAEKTDVCGFMNSLSPYPMAHRKQRPVDLGRIHVRGR